MLLTQPQSKTTEVSSIGAAWKSWKCTRAKSRIPLCRRKHRTCWALLFRYTLTLHYNYPHQVSRFWELFFLVIQHFAFKTKLTVKIPYRFCSCGRKAHCPTPLIDADYHVLYIHYNIRTLKGSGQSYTISRASRVCDLIKLQPLSVMMLCNTYKKAFLWFQNLKQKNFLWPQHNRSTKNDISSTMNNTENMSVGPGTRFVRHDDKHQQPIRNKVAEMLIYAWCCNGFLQLSKLLNFVDIRKTQGSCTCLCRVTWIASMKQRYEHVRTNTWHIAQPLCAISALVFFRLPSSQKNELFSSRKTKRRILIPSPFAVKSAWKSLFFLCELFWVSFLVSLSKQ